MTPEEVRQARSNWVYRRLLGFLCAVGALAGLFLLIPYGQDTGLHRAIADGFVWVIVVIVPTYIGVPVADDFLKRRRREP